MTRFLAGLLCIGGILGCTSMVLWSRPADTPPSIALSIYVDGVADGQPAFAASTPFSRLEIVSAERIPGNRPLLLVIDPTSYPRAELQTHVVALGKELARRKAPGTDFRVRVGFTVMDGVMGDPIDDRANLPEALDRALANYVPDGLTSRGIDAARTLEITSNLLRKSGPDGPVDVLILAKDREASDSVPAYVGSAMERRLVFDCLRHGSTVYVYAGGNGLLSRAGIASGGEVFSHGSVGPDEVLHRILDARGKGFRLSLRHPGNILFEGRIELAIEASGTASQAASRVRAPVAFWLRNDGSQPPGYSDVIQALELIRRAQDAAAASDFSSATQYLERAMEGDPWNGSVYAIIARMALDRDDLAAARGYAARAMHTLPREPEAVLVYGDVSERMGKAADALEEIRKPKVVPDEPALQQVLGRLLASTKQYEEASRIYSKLLGAGQDNARIRAEYGWVLLKTGELRGAAEQFQASLAHSPEYLKALSGKAELALLEKRIPEALELSNRALKAHPGSPEALLQLAKGLIATEKWDEAASNLEAASRDPALAGEALPLLVDARLRAGKSADAEELLVRHLAEDPSDSNLHRQLAEVRTVSGNLGAAAAALESGAAKIRTPKHELYLEAAGLRERRGEFGQALLDYRAALDAAPSQIASRLSESLGSHMDFLSVLMGGSRDSSPAPGLEKPQTLPAVDVNVQNGANDSDATSEPEDRGLILPGGRDFLARTMGIPGSALEGSDALERVFFHVLSSGSAHFKRPDENSLHRAITTTLKHYRDLIRHLIKLRLLHEDNDLEKEQTFVFPLAGPDAKMARTDKFLSFFGVDYRYRKSDNSVSLVMKQNRKSEERQMMLRNLGVDLMNRNLRVIQLTLRNERIPVLLGSDAWETRILSRDKDRPLFERILRAPDAMALYVALANCSEPARQVLFGAGADLLGMSDLLVAFGRYLEVRDGRVVVPGDPQAWLRLLGTPVTDAKTFTLELLRRDGGRALQLLQSLLFADDSVQQYLTGSPERFLQFYQLLSPNENTRSDSWNRGTSRQEPGRLLRLISADDQGLFMRLDPRWGRYLSGFTKAATPGNTSGRLRLDPASLAELMNRVAGNNPAHQTGVIEILELMSYIETSRPEMLDDAGIAAFLQNPAMSPLALNLIWEVNPSQQLLVKYLGYCRELVEMPDKAREWKNNRTRSSQAVFYLLSALSREDVLGHSDANRLLEESLNRFSSINEAQFGQALAEFVSDHLLPSLKRAGGSKTDDILMEALAGKTENIDFLFEGKGLQLEPNGFRLQRMKTSIQHQSVLPLSRILAIYELAGSKDKLRELASELEKLSKEQKFADLSKKALREIPHADLETIARQAQEAAGRGSGSADLHEKIASEMHLELGVALLSYCYAYNGTPEIDLLTFDPHFIRKHQFYVEYTRPDVWRTTYLEQQESIGSVLTGSLSGLAFELGRLETSQSGQAFGATKGSGLVPSILAGMRAVPSTLRSTRAQEFVALTVRLGLEAAVRSASDPQMKDWCAGRFRQMLSPRRRERLSSWIEQPDMKPEAQALSRSELFLLGQAYLEDFPGSAPALKSPILERLKNILPQPGTPERAQFRREVEQYGVHLRSRIGLDQISFSLADPYEVLERNLKDEVLFERICDLKIRIAELNHSLGLPAGLAGFEGELALRDILPDSNQVRVSTWMAALEQIAGLDLENVRSWIDELVNRACIREVPDSTAAANGVGK